MRHRKGALRARFHPSKVPTMKETNSNSLENDIKIECLKTERLGLPFGKGPCRVLPPGTDRGKRGTWPPGRTWHHPLVLVFYRHTELKNYRAMVAWTTCRRKATSDPLNRGDQQQGQLVSREPERGVWSVSWGRDAGVWRCQEHERSSKAVATWRSLMEEKATMDCNRRAAQACGAQHASTAWGWRQAHRAGVSLLGFGLAISLPLFRKRNIYSDQLHIGNMSFFE